MKMTIILSLFFSSTLAWSYPIYFKCDKEGSLSQVVTPSELASKLQQVVNTAQGLSPEKQKQFLSETCRGGKSCIEELEQLLKMAQSSGKVTEDWVKQQISKVKSEADKAQGNLMGFVKLPNAKGELLSTYNKLIKNAAESVQCRIAEAQIPADGFKLDGDRCVVANLHHSPYMYVSGIRESGTTLPGNQMMGAPPCSGIDMMIEGAVAAGQDPYAALAISFMENGTRVSELYLDPIGMVQTLGCKTSHGTEKSNNLDSYNTYYNVEYRTIDNSPLLSKIKNYLTIRQIKMDDKVSYFCNAYAGGGAVGAAPAKNACCIKMPFTPEGYFGNGREHPIAKALTFKSMDQYIKAPLSSELKANDPSENAARRLQRFNGYSTLMGGAEAVSAWRSGVNYYKTPAYGYQAMDFLVNSMLTNPYIRSKVEAAESKVGKSSPSVLCMELSPGVYSMEHNLYFQKHADAPRMESVFEKWKQNKANPSLTKGQSNVMRGEFMALISSKKYPEFAKLIDNNIFYDKTKPLPPAALTYYFEKIYPDRQTVAKANKMDQGFEWNEMEGAKFDSFLKSYKKLVTIQEYKSNGNEEGDANTGYMGLGVVQYVDSNSVLYIAPAGTKLPEGWKINNSGMAVPPANFTPPATWKSMQQPVVDPSTGKLYFSPKNFKIPADWIQTPFGQVPPADWKPGPDFKEYKMEDWAKDYSNVLKDLGHKFVE